MEWIFAQCGAFSVGNMPALLGLAAAGLIGSLSHCSLTCGPLVAMQALWLEGKTPLLKPLTVYHLGRISVYAMLGLVAQTGSSMLFSDALDRATQLLVLLAGGAFIFSAVWPHQAHASCCDMHSSSHTSARKLPLNLTLFLRGAAMGLMPCGLVYAALLLAATLHSPWEAFAGMAAFGLATTPMLHLASTGARRFARNRAQHLPCIRRAALLLSGVWLSVIGLHHMTFI